MKKSGSVSLGLVAAMAAALTGCNRRHVADPCQPETFNDYACQQAVNSGGYYYNGTWFPMHYSYPYPHYYDTYRSYTSRGGRVSSFGSGSYARPSGSVTRGGFGVTGGGRSFGSHGAGE